MERPSTPPGRTTAAVAAGSPPTPEVTRRIEENRLRAKALRDQHEAAQRAAGNVISAHKTPSGLVTTNDIHVVGGGPRKRPHTSIAAPEIPQSNRDGSRQDDAEIRPAPKFTKYVDYNFSSMTDTKGGFLSSEDDPWNKALSADGRPGAEEKPKHMTAAEWERLQLIRSLQRRKEGPFEPGLSVLSEKKEQKKCRECGSLEIDWVWDEVFQCRVCNACKDKYPEKYSLLTKTECKQDYLLTDPELRDEELLPHLSRPNPHKSHWHDMMLFLRYQVEEYAFKDKWGSSEALDAEFEKRETDKKRRKEAKFKDKLLELKKRTRSEAYRRNTKAGIAANGPRAVNFGDDVGGGGRHVHEWGRTVENEEGMTIKKCLNCGMEVEELEF